MIEKNCSVAAFESSVKSLCKKIAETKNIALSDELKIYFMMPQLTSLPIFNYFNNPDNVASIPEGAPTVEKTINEIVSQRIGKTNPVVIKSEEYNKEIFPRHMLNVIGGSNTPRANLIKYARENQSPNCNWCRHTLLQALACVLARVACVFSKGSEGKNLSGQPQL